MGLPETETFPLCLRIRKRSEYLAIQGRGRKLESAHFLLFVRAATEGMAPTRVGFTVSKRVGGAVVRNRLKRRLREICRRNRRWFPTGFDLVLVAKPSARGVVFSQAASEIELFSRRLQRR